MVTELEKGIAYFEKGETGIDKDPEEEFRWIALAAISGDIEALGRIGHNLFHGMGIEKDETLGIELLMKAANLGDCKACGQMFSICCKAAILDPTNSAVVCEAIKWGEKLPQNDPNHAKMIEMLRAALNGISYKLS